MSIRVTYNRQVGKRIVHLGFLEFNDFVIMTASFGILAGFGRWPAALATPLAYVVYGFLFRYKRAPGFDLHWFKRMLAPKHRRPGHIDLHGHFQIPNDKDIK